MNKARKPKWAVFNLAIDPDNFQFDVAVNPGRDLLGRYLGKVLSGDLPSFTNRVTCQVFFHAEHPGKRKRRTSYLPPKGLDIFSPVDPEKPGFANLDFDCLLQLSLALRLFKPAPFWVTAWQRRDEVRVWPGPRSYTLQGEELTRFCEVSKKLLPFHERRNLYGFYRNLPSEERARSVNPSDPTGERFLSKTAYLVIVTDLFEQAHGNWWLSSEMRLILLLMAAEALFTDEDKSELAYRLSHRIAMLNGPDREERKRIFESAKGLYDTRSRLVHGTFYQKKRGFIAISPDDVLDFSKLVRSSLLYFIALNQNEMDKNEILRGLDRAVFDDGEVLSLRFRANEFWGFGNSVEEHLYSNTWSVRNETVPQG